LVLPLALDSLVPPPAADVAAVGGVVASSELSVEGDISVARNSVCEGERSSTSVDEEEDDESGGQGLTPPPLPLPLPPTDLLG